MEIRSPTNKFISVDLPTFGLPTIFTNPALCISIYIGYRQKNASGSRCVFPLSAVRFIFYYHHQELTNESDLRINISNKNTKKVYEYYFSKKDKSYYLNISTLPKGIYNFTAEARYGSIIYSEKGSFTVDDVGAEAQDLVANSQRMQLLSSLTGGKNFYVNELDKLTKAIDNDERITSIMREETDYKDLINMKSLFFVILSLVSIEWILRKIFGTY